VERLIECRLPRGVNCIGLAVMYLVRGHQTDAAMVVVPVVPIEEAAAETSGVLDAAEALGELRLVLECLEVTFREWVVVGDVRPVVRAGNAEIGEQQRGGLGLHRSAAIGMQGELAGRDVVLGDGVVEQWLEESSALGIGNAPADYAAAEDVENDVEIKVTPFGWSYQLGDVPDQTSFGRSASSSGLR